MELELREKATNELDKENFDLNKENMDQPAKRLRSTIFSVLENLKYQNA